MQYIFLLSSNFVLLKKEGEMWLCSAMWYFLCISQQAW